jgi:hypothetical protein
MRQGGTHRRRPVLNAKTYSRRDERRILDVLGRGLLKDFPNPERIGCPGADVLKKIASHEMPLSEAENWLDHLGSCSPCYADFKRFQEAVDRQRRQRWLAIAAGILLAIAVTGWALLHRRNENLLAQTAVLDLSNLSAPRGVGRNPNQRPLELSRRVSKLTILLPLGSSEGFYQARIATLSGESIVTSSGTAKLKDGATSLQLSLNLASLPQGKYVLQVRKLESEWESYPLVLR